jgi:superfamily II DNA/RNA helicase
MLPRGVQNVLFSATFPDQVQDFADKIAPEANKIFLKKEEVTVDAIKQLWLECNGEEEKYEALAMLYGVMSIGQSMVFCKVGHEYTSTLSANQSLMLAQRHCRPHCRASHRRRPFSRLSPR